MPLFGKKSRPTTAAPPEPQPSVSDADLAAVSLLMDHWDAAMGNSDAIYSCLEAIARHGGWKGEDATMMEAISRGGAASTVTQRPWRWWDEAARRAQSEGKDTLVGRIFLFTHMFAQQMAPKMNWQTLASVGLDPPAEETYKSIAASAVGSLARLDPNLLIHNTATGRVDVANALKWAEELSGVVASRAYVPTSPLPPTSSAPSDASGPFNTL